MVGLQSAARPAERAARREGTGLPRCRQVAGGSRQIDRVARQDEGGSELAAGDGLRRQGMGDRWPVAERITSRCRLATPSSTRSTRPLTGSISRRRPIPRRALGSCRNRSAGSPAPGMLPGDVRPPPLRDGPPRSRGLFGAASTGRAAGRDGSSGGRPAACSSRARGVHRRAHPDGRPSPCRLHLPRLRLRLLRGDAAAGDALPVPVQGRRSRPHHRPGPGRLAEPGLRQRGVRAGHRLPGLRLTTPSPRAALQAARGLPPR
jgi:hypothetical protein